MAEPFILGVNYWPRAKAMYWWKDFEEKEVETEFDEIRSLNLKLVRVFLLWEDFQPSPQEVYSKSIRNLQTVLEIADTKGLQILVTLFTGHMSGANWVPAWALSSNKLSPNQFRTISKNRSRDVQIGYFYRDPRLLRAQCHLIRQLVPKIQKYPALYGWDLGNEPSILLKPHRVADIIHWFRTLKEELKKLDPHHPITLGIHQGDLSADTKFHPNMLAKHLDIPSMHGYPNYSTWSRNPLDTKAPAFLNHLTERMTRKKVLFAEFGLPIPPRNQISKLRKISTQICASEDEAEKYFKNALTHLYRAGSRGALAWCYSDYYPSLKSQAPFDEAPHELYFGITHSDGRLKKTAAALKAWGKSKRTVRKTPSIKGFSTLGYFRAPERNLKKLYRIFLEQL